MANPTESLYKNITLNDVQLGQRIPAAWVKIASAPTNARQYCKKAPLKRGFLLERYPGSLPE